ncbi:MAG: hypothetical protein WAT39_07965 [Planctomycetota bacterium]
MTIQYEGNALHKRHAWFGKPPALRCDKTECPANVAPEEALAVLSRAIAQSLEQGLHSVLADGDHPKYVWGRSSFATSDGGERTVTWEACSSSRTALVYHAYPIRRDRRSDTMPQSVEEVLWPDD